MSSKESLQYVKGIPVERQMADWVEVLQEIWCFRKILMDVNTEENNSLYQKLMSTRAAVSLVEGLIA